MMQLGCRSYVWLCAFGALITTIPSGASAETSLSGHDFHSYTIQSAESLQRWYNQKGLWDTTGWWNAAHCVEAVENAIAVQNGGDYLPVLKKTFDLNSSQNFLNEFYDDEGWWALAWIRAYDLTGESQYLDMAKTIFADLCTGWDDHCGGGIWWKKDRRYKNAVANELFLAVAIRLHQRTPGDGGKDSYLNWALKEWGWFTSTGMINDQNLINDGLNRNCENNRRTTWTYNQGVVLGGLTDLYKSTGNEEFLKHAISLADASTSTLVYSNGILREPCEPDRCGGADVPQFKGIFIRYLADLYDVTRKTAYHDLIVASGRSVWANNRDSQNRFGLKWTGPIDEVDAARHSSAMMPISVLAQPATKLLPVIVGAGSPGFGHEVGEASGNLAWSVSGQSAVKPGLLFSGLRLESLRGPQVAHFRIAVDGTNSSTSALVRLEAVGPDGVVAARDITMREFPRLREGLGFPLRFTNSAQGGPIELRVHWLNASNAPVLTLLDISVGGGLNWSAANLRHDVGRLDAHNFWCADPVRDADSGYLARGSATGELKRGKYQAHFELKVDNFNKDQLKVATLSVVETRKDGKEKIVAERTLKRSDFKNVLFHDFPLTFRAREGRRYEFRTLWNYHASAARLTQRSVVVTQK